MKILQKVLAIVCAFAVTATMVFPSSMVGLIAHAEDIQSDIGSEEQSNEENKDEIQFVVDYEESSDLENAVSDLANEEMLMSGQCGENATWVLDEFGKLTISGTGKMYDYGSESNKSPWNCREDIKKVVIEYGITTIGWNSFCGCKNLKLAVIPDSVTNIGYCSFYYCNSLTFVSIPKSVTEIGNYAFNGSGIKSVYYKGSKEEWNDIHIFFFNQTLQDSAKHFNSPGKLVGNWDVITPYYSTDEYQYRIYENEITIDKYIGEDKVGIVVPNEIDGYPVTHISNCAFSDLTNLKSLYLPKGISEIYNFVMTVQGYIYNCTNLENIFVDEDNEKYCDIDGVVYSKDKSKVVSYPEGRKDRAYTVLEGINTVQDGAFKRNNYLEELYLPEGILEIGYSAFEGCNNLKELNIPNSVTKIGLFAFEFTDNLGETVDGAKYVDDCLIEAPDKKDIIVRNGTRLISSTAFEWDQYGGNELVESIELPKSIVAVNTRAFFWCKNLKDVYYHGSENDWNEIKIGEKNEHLTDAYMHYSSEKISFSRDTNYAVIGENDAIIRLNYIGSEGINTIDCSTVDENIVAVTKTDVVKFSDDNPVWGENPFGKNTSVNIYVKGLKKGLTRLVVTINGIETSFTNIISDDKKLVVGCNRTDLNITDGEYFILNACVSSKKGVHDSKIRFEFNSSEFKKEQDFNSNEYSRIALRVLKPGDFEVRVIDEITGLIKVIPINARSKTGNTYTIYSIPIIYKPLSTNFIHNGLYVDSYRWNLKKDENGNEFCELSFEVYNERSSYGIVEVYNKDGDLESAELISPAEGLPTDVWDATLGNLTKLGKDIVFSVKTGEWFTYRQEAGNSTHTSIRIPYIPKGGYVKITNDPLESDVLLMVQTADIIMEWYSVFKGAKEYTKSMREEFNEVTMKEFVSKLKLNSISVKSVIKSIKDKIVNKTLSPETLAEIITSDDVIQVLKEVILNIDYSKVLIGYAKSDLEKVLLEAPGVPREIKAILDTAFTAYGAINFYGTMNSFANSFNSGCISIFVPNNISLSFNNVSISGAFDEYTSLEVFRVTFDENIKNILPPSLSAIPDDYPFVYNISLYLNGQEVQPNSDILVSIKIPDELQAYVDCLSVYRIEDNNVATLLDTKVDGGKIVFVTNHLSKYVLIPSQIPSTIAIPNNVIVTTSLEKILNNGDKVKEGDVLHIEVIAPEGKKLSSLTVNGVAIENGATYTVGTENVVIAVTFDDITTPPAEKIVITIPENVVVTREGIALNTSDEIHSGDVLRIEATVPAGKKLTSFTVNGVTIENGSTYTVGGEDVIISVAFDDIETPSTDRYTITIPSGITVTRNSLTLKNGDEISEGDALNIKANIPSGYKLTSLTVNGKSIANGGTYTVGKENVIIAVSFEKLTDDNPNKPDTPSKPDDGSNSDVNNDQPYIISNSDIIGWNSILSELNISSDKTVMVDMNGTTVLPANILHVIKDNNIKLMLKMDNQVSWSIDGKDVEKIDRDVDLKVIIGADNIPDEAIKKFVGERKYLTLSIKHNGDFGFSAFLVIDAGEQYSNEPASLYWFNDNAFKLEDSCRVQYGKAVLKFTHASDWIIAFGEAKNNTDSDNSNSDNSTDDTSRPIDAKPNETTSDESNNSKPTTTDPNDSSDDEKENPHTGGSRVSLATFLALVTSAALCLITRKQKR